MHACTYAYIHTYSHTHTVNLTPFTKQNLMYITIFHINYSSFKLIFIYYYVHINKMNILVEYQMLSPNTFLHRGTYEKGDNGPVFIFDTSLSPSAMRSRESG